MMEQGPPEMDPSFEPQQRARSNTWPLPRPDNFLDVVVKQEPGVEPAPAAMLGPCAAGVHGGGGGGSPAAEPVYLSPAAVVGAAKKNTSRRNAWGNLSYADLITQAIQSAPDQRLTLSQIYEWMVQNVPYFKDKGDSNSSAGWKNSIRHNLSLHNRFMRVQNEGTGKSSWWMINPDAKPGKSARRRATSMETSKFEKRRGRVKKKVAAGRRAVVQRVVVSAGGGAAQRAVGGGRDAVALQLGVGGPRPVPRLAAARRLPAEPRLPAARLQQRVVVRRPAVAHPVRAGHGARVGPAAAAAAAAAAAPAAAAPAVRAGAAGGQPGREHEAAPRDGAGAGAALPVPARAAALPAAAPAALPAALRRLPPLAVVRARVAAPAAAGAAPAAAAQRALHHDGPADGRAQQLDAARRPQPQHRDAARRLRLQRGRGDQARAEHGRQPRLQLQPAPPPPVGGGGRRRHGGLGRRPPPAARRRPGRRALRHRALLGALAGAETWSEQQPLRRFHPRSRQGVAVGGAPPPPGSGRRTPAQLSRQCAVRGSTPWLPAACAPVRRAQTKQDSDCRWEKRDLYLTAMRGDIASNRFCFFPLFVSFAFHLWYKKECVSL